VPADCEITVNVGNDGTVRYGKRVTMKCGEYPVARTVYYYGNGAWRSINIGPGQPDTVLGQLLFPVGGFNVPIVSQQTYTHTGPLNSLVPLNTQYQQLTVQFAGTVAAQTSGPIINANCELAVETLQLKRTSSGTASANVINPTPIYVHPTDFEGQFGVVVDSGLPTDTDGDGVPDTTDVDDDNDGRNDFSDKFPLDPNEKDDTDNDGIGDNADPDDDNDGTPDTEDDLPYDPTKQYSDRDGDGVRDTLDRWPDNKAESSDHDGDGVGDNEDPDDDNDLIRDESDETPKGPVTSGDGSAGNGNGGAGTGDGAGGPGPIPIPGGDGTSEGTAGTGDPSGEVKPGAQHDIAGKAKDLGETMGNKVGGVTPFAASVFPQVNTYTLTVTTKAFGTITHTFRFDESPWTLLRTFLLLVISYVLVRDVFQRLTI
jgi:hypothetical protein